MPGNVAVAEALQDDSPALHIHEVPIALVQSHPQLLALEELKVNHPFLYHFKSTHIERDQSGVPVVHPENHGHGHNVANDYENSHRRSRNCGVIEKDTNQG